MSFPPQGSGTGSGGGDAYFVGWFSDPTELASTYPTAEAGQYAKVVSTGTIWTWDIDTSTWVNSGISVYTDGDMLKSVYDINADGVVNDSDRLGGKLPSAYVETSRTINSHTLTTDITLDSDDITEGATNLYHRQSDWDEIDSGEPSYIQNKPDLTDYVEKVPTATEDNLASFDGTGTVQDSGYTVDDGQITTAVLWTADKIQTEIDDAISQTITLQGSWNADTNTPTLPPDPLSIGDAWYVSTAGSTTLGDVTAWATGEMAVYGAEGWFKIGSSSQSGVWGGITGTITDQLDLISYISNSTVSNANTLDGHDSTYFASTEDIPIPGYGLSDLGGEFNVNVNNSTIGINGSDQLYVINGRITGAVNLGSGEGEVYHSTVSDELQLRSLLAGDRITITQDGENITISSTGGVGTGDVVGPSSATIDNISVFASTDGKIIEDSGYAISDLIQGPPVSTVGNFLSFATTNGGMAYDSGYSPSNIITTFSGLSDVLISAPATGDVPQYNGALGTWVNTQLDYGDVYGPSSSTTNVIAKFDGTSGKSLSSTDITINSSNNINLNQHTIYNGTIDGGNLDA